MKALLVAPTHSDTFWSFKHVLPFIGKRTADPPLGLLTMAAMLPPAWDCRLVDLNVENLDDDTIRWADVVMIGGMLIQKGSIKDVARRCRRLETPVVAGGPLFTMETAGDYPDIDTVVVGEAEDLIADLVADLEAGRPARLYEATSFPDITTTPGPRWDLIDMNHYAAMSVQFSRGCPFNCEFCDIVALNGRVPRLKTVPQVLRELDELHRRGWRRTVFMVDDNFIGNRRAAKNLLRAIAGWRREVGAKLTFVTEASVDLAADAELLALMVEAGFTKVFLGIETPDAGSLKACSKFHNTRCDLVEAVRTIQRAGIEVMGGFIVGFDDDKPDIFERQFEFIQRAGVVTAMVGLLQALPRSRLYERLRTEKRLLGDGDGENTAARFNFVPRLDPEVLIARYQHLVRRLYEPGHYYRRIRTFLEVHRPGGPAVKVGPAEIGAFLRALWVIGIVNNGRRAFWGFLGSTLRHHPAQLGLAMTLVIYGHHFRIVANRI